MDMSELIDPFARLIEDICTPAAIREIEQGGDASAMWNAFLESGFLDALVAEAKWIKEGAPKDHERFSS